MPNDFYADLSRGITTLILAALLCVPLVFLFPANETQPKKRAALFTNGMYWLLDSVFHRPVVLILSVAVLLMLNPPDSAQSPTAQALQSLPLWVQFLLLTFAIDFMQYWVHRLLHRNPMWKFHAVHHSSKHMDWHSSARLHPVNTIIYSILPSFIVGFAHFNPVAFGLYGLTITFYSPLNHSNLNWTFGPLRYVIGSPVYHRWHHSDEIYDKNFAFYFPFIDVMFGTFYMPKGKIPATTGIPDPVPEGFIGQMAYPFRRIVVPKQEASALPLNAE